MDEVDILYDILMPNVSTADTEETVCTISPPLVSSTPKRKPTWTDLEQSVLLEEVTKREKSLFGKFKGCGRGKKRTGDSMGRCGKSGFPVRLIIFKH